jgi:hypothetical protein
LKTCARCKKRLKETSFYKDASRGCGLQARCKECDRELEIIKRSKVPNQITRAKYAAWAYGSLRGRAQSIVKSCRNAAKRSGVSFDLNLEWMIEQIERGTCAYSGLEFDLSKPTKSRVHPRAPSADRIVAGGGYTMSNVRIVCWQLNMARCTYGDDLLNELAFAIVRTISSRASQEEGSTTIPKGSSAKRHEAPNAVLN